MLKPAILLLGVHHVLSANILYVAPMPSPSHHIWNRALAIGLVNKGHNVTYVAPNSDGFKNENFSHILLEGIFNAIDNNFDINELASYSSARMIFEFQKYCLLFCKTYAKSQGLQQLLNYPEDFKFDLIVFDVTGGGCLFPIIQKFKYPPVVGVTAFLLPPYVANNFGNHLYPAYIPWYGLPYSQNMSFMERVWNSLFTYADVIAKHPKQQTEADSIMRGIFGNHVPSIQEFERHISLVLANTDPILNYPQPLPPNIIPVGGLHTKAGKQLPPDLQSVLDDAKHGAILFSLGTNVRSDKLDKKVQQALLEAFGKIQETVIWKFESEISDLPKNVIVRKFLPQNDILGHPNVKLFIGHGGAMSTQEAMFHGVPMICVPFFMDQHINSRNIVERQLGISLDFRKITSGYVLQKLREALDNPVYTQKMKRLSRIFKDRLETPLERGIFWTEYVLRHGGAEFLNTPARDLPFFVSSGLDVVIFLVLVVTAAITLVYKLVKGILNLMRTKKKKIKGN